MHQLERQADQLRVAGIWPDAPTEPFAAPPPDAAWIGRRVQHPRRGQPRPHVILVPGAMSDPPESRWPVAAFADVALRLRKQGYDVLVVGGPQDAPLAHAIQHRAQVRDMTGRPDFAHLGALAARAALAIGNVTGLMHLIAAAGAPTLSLFSGQGDPALTGPRGHVAVLQAERLENLPPTEVMRAIQRLTPLIQRTV